MIQRRRMQPWLTSLCMFALALSTTMCRGQEAAKTDKVAANKVEWTPLFNGKDLTNWKKSGFSNQGEVEVKDGAIVMEIGPGSITGITLTKEFPKTNFEVHFEARRTKGSDFFCGLTFPVGDSHASLISGGWGGSVTGVSSIDGMDASENSSSKYIKYENDKWYDFRVRVTPTTITAWIEGTKEVEVDLEGHRLSTRIEVDRSKPLGFSAYESRAEIRKIEWRELKAEDAK